MGWIEYGFLIFGKFMQQHLHRFCHVSSCFPTAGFSVGRDMNQFDSLIGSISERLHEALLLQAGDDSCHGRLRDTYIGRDLNGHQEKYSMSAIPLSKIKYNEQYIRFAINEPIYMIDAYRQGNTLCYKLLENKSF